VTSLSPPTRPIKIAVSILLIAAASAVNAHYILDVGGPAFNFFVTIPMSCLGGIGLGHEVARQLEIVSVPRRLAVTATGGVVGMQIQSLLIASLISLSNLPGMFVNLLPISVVLSVFLALGVEPLHRRFGFS
jgi:hypothetical protein